MKKLLLLSSIFLLTACGVTEVIRDPNTNNFVVSSSHGSLDGSWSRSTAEASQKAIEFCTKQGQDYIFIREDRTGVVGWSPQKSEITFACGQNNKKLFNELSANCQDKMQITDLDPIRNKVELFKPDGSIAPTFDIASNTNYPTATEKDAIAKWAKIREECTAKTLQTFKDSLQSNNAMQSVFNQKIVEFGNQYNSFVASLVVALYQGKLPYGEFAQKRHEGFLASKSAERDFRSATMIQDRNAQMQAQDLALKQQQNSINALNGYMNSVNARQPVTQPTPYFIPPVKSPTVTNCNKFGNNINCVTQ